MAARQHLMIDTGRRRERLDVADKDCRCIQPIPYRIGWELGRLRVDTTAFRKAVWVMSSWTWSAVIGKCR